MQKVLGALLLFFLLFGEAILEALVERFPILLWLLFIVMFFSEGKLGFGCLTFIGMILWLIFW